MVPNIVISGYRAWVNKEGIAMPGCRPYNTDFYSEMYRIKNGEYKEIIDQCRRIKDKAARNQFKCQNLPSLTISSVCRDWRKTENIVRHTGLLNLDIDKEGNEWVEDWGQLRDDIFAIKDVVAAFLSASGEGVSFVVKIYPEKHKDTFFSIVDEMKTHMSIKVDAGLHDFIRLRFVSYDPDCRIREDFDTIKIITPSPQYMLAKKDYGRSEVSLEPEGEADSEHNYLEAVKKAESMYPFADGSKHRFLVSVAGSCNLMGMSEDFCKSMTLKLFAEKTSISDKKLLEPIERVYKTYRSQRGTYKYEAKYEKLNQKLKRIIVFDYLHAGKKPTDDDILAIAKENEANIERVNDIIKRVFAEFGNELGYNSFPTIDKVEIFIRKRWTLFFNTVTQQPEQATLGSNDIGQVNVDEIYRQLLKYRFKFPFNNLKSLLKSEFMHIYDPISDYFKALAFQGEGHIDKLASYIECEDQAFWLTQFKKALVRSIPCGMGIQENRIVMVLHGAKQETGKSTFIRNLNPWGVARYYSESPVLEGGKDSEFKFAENFILNLEELAALNNHDIERLKAVISKRNIKERRAYAVYESEMPRRCNIWASTNQDAFLQDFENTRWLIFTIKSINWDYKKDVDMRAVWAEAYWLYQNGFDYQLTKEERAVREARNELARLPMAEEELVIRHFTPNEVEGMFFTPSEIAAWLSNLYNLRLSAWKIGRAVKKVFGLSRVVARINDRVVHGYYFVRQSEGIHASSAPGKVEMAKPDAKPPDTFKPFLEEGDQF